MTQLVNDSIELARIGTGPVALNRASCSVETLISSTIEELRTLLESRELGIEAEPSLPMFDIEDRKRKRGSLVRGLVSISLAR